MSRRTELAGLIPELLEEWGGQPVHIEIIYAAIENRRPDLVDDEPDPHAPNRKQWKHDVRWELKTAVNKERIAKRDDIGRGYYAADIRTHTGPADSFRVAPIEDIKTHSPSLRKPIDARRIHRKEAKLVKRYEAAFEKMGGKLWRIEFRVAGRRFVADAYDSERNLLIEAKSQITRPDIRMAIGQLMDYAFLLDRNSSKAVLLPTSPSGNLRSLLTSCEIGWIYQAGQDFEECLV